MLIETETEKNTTFANGIQLPERFVDALSNLNTSIEQARQLIDVSTEARRILIEDAEKICGLTNGIVSYRVMDKVVTFSAGDRVLTFIHLNGSARDTRLVHPRCMQCAKVLVFSHYEGDYQSVLRTSYRIYPDGVMSDGFVSWSLRENSGFMSYLAHTLARYLLANEPVWSDMIDIPDSLKVLPLVEGKVAADKIGDRWPAFECTFEPNPVGP